MKFLYVTGTNTEIGKTITSAALMVICNDLGLKVGYCKPAQSGIDDSGRTDTDVVSHLAQTDDVIAFETYISALSPNFAAIEDNLPLLKLDETVKNIKNFANNYDLIIIEGAGGLMAPLGKNNFTLLDVHHEIPGPFIIVTSLEMGTINHTHLTKMVCIKNGIQTLGLIYGCVEKELTMVEKINSIEMPKIVGLNHIYSLDKGMGLLNSMDFKNQILKINSQFTIEKILEDIINK